MNSTTTRQAQQALKTVRQQMRLLSATAAQVALNDRASRRGNEGEKFHNAYNELAANLAAPGLQAVDTLAALIGANGRQ